MSPRQNQFHVLQGAAGMQCGNAASSASTGGAFSCSGGLGAGEGGLEMPSCGYTIARVLSILSPWNDATDYRGCIYTLCCGYIVLRLINVQGSTLAETFQGPHCSRLRVNRFRCDCWLCKSLCHPVTVWSIFSFYLKRGYVPHPEIRVSWWRKILMLGGELLERLVSL